MSQKLSFQLLVKRHLPSSIDDVDEQVKELMNISHVRLDREKLTEIDNLELLGPKVTNLYLQENLIESINNIDCLINLRVLILSGNKISKVENLLPLKKLGYLDLSDNKIEDLTIEELPRSLVILNLRGNPCRHLPDYKKRLISHLPILKDLDEHKITHSEDYSDDNDEDEDVLSESEYLDDGTAPPLFLIKDHTKIDIHNHGIPGLTKEALATHDEEFDVEQDISPIEDDVTILTSRTGKELERECSNFIQNDTQSILVRSQTRMEEALKHYKRMECDVLRVKELLKENK